MRAVEKAVQYRRSVSDRHYDQAARTVLAFAGALFSLLGLVLAAGGYLSIDGSAFHIFAGLVLMVSGALVARRHPAGAWTYMLVFASTVCWSLRNVDVGSSLTLRLVGPCAILLMIALVMPLLCRWRPRQTATVFIVLITTTVVLSISSLPNGPLAGQTAGFTKFLDAETQGVVQ